MSAQWRPCAACLWQRCPRWYPLLFPNKTGGNVFNARNTPHIGEASCYFSGGIERAVRHQIISCVYVFPQHMAMAARRTAAAWMWKKKKRFQQSVTFFFFPRVLDAQPQSETTAASSTSSSSSSYSSSSASHSFVPLRLWTVITPNFFFFSIPLATTCAERERRKGIDGSYCRLSSRITGCCSNCPAMFAFSWSGIWNITRWPGMGEQWGLQGAPRGNDTVLARANGNVFFQRRNLRHKWQQ